MSDMKKTTAAAMASVLLATADYYKKAKPKTLQAQGVYLFNGGVWPKALPVPEVWTVADFIRGAEQRRKESI